MATTKTIHTVVHPLMNMSAQLLAKFLFAFFCMILIRLKVHHTVRKITAGFPLSFDVKIQGLSKTPRTCEMKFKDFQAPVLFSSMFKALN